MTLTSRTYQRLINQNLFLFENGVIGHKEYEKKINKLNYKFCK